MRQRGKALAATVTPPQSPARLEDADLAAVLRGLADGVVISDAAGVIVFWNAGAERILGWSAEEAIGQTLDLIVPEPQRRAHWEGYKRVMDTGHTRYGAELLRVPSLHADGTRRSLAFTVTLLSDATGSITGVAAVIRDETDRWAAEQELRRQAKQ